MRLFAIRFPGIHGYVLVDSLIEGVGDPGEKDRRVVGALDYIDRQSSGVSGAARIATDVTV
jgi:hypothetical protein